MLSQKCDKSSQPYGDKKSAAQDFAGAAHRKHEYAKNINMDTNTSKNIPRTHHKYITSTKKKPGFRAGLQLIACTMD